MNRWQIRGVLRLLGIALFFIILSQLDLGRILRVAASADRIGICLAAALQMIVLLIKSRRWTILLRTQGLRVRSGLAFRYYAVSGFLGVVTPGRVGELWKSMRLRNDAGIPLARSLPATVVDRALDFYIYLVMGVSVILVYGLFDLIEPFAGALLLALLAAPIALWNRKVIDNLVYITALTPLSRNTSANWRIAGDAWMKLRSPRLVPALMLSILCAALLCVQFWLLAGSLDLQFSDPVYVTIASVALLKFTTAIPISIAGIGTRDATLVYIFAFLALPPEPAVALALLLLLVSQLTVAVLGMVIFLWEAKSA